MTSNNTIYQIKRKDSQTSALSRSVEYRNLRSREIVNLTVNVAGTGDMQKSIYDADDDGVVDFAKDLALNYEDWTQFNLILLS